MKKKILFMLPCIAAVVTATFVGTKSIKSNVRESNALLMENVEALSAGADIGGDTGFFDKYKCNGEEKICAVMVNGDYIVGEKIKIK